MLNTTSTCVKVLCLALGIHAAAGAQEIVPLLVSASKSDQALASTDINPPPLAPAPSVIILDYHSFLDNHDSSIDFSLEEFANQLDAMTALGYKFVSMDEVVTGKIEGRANVLITIDDGNHSVYKAYTEVLKPRGIRPVLFVYPAIILGRQKFALTEEQLVELAKDGCTIGAHGYHHMPLSDKALATNSKDFLIEVRKPGPAIEKILGSAPLFFAYPYGVYSKEAEKDLKAAGYELAFAAGDKIVPVTFGDPALDPMAIPRAIVYRWSRPIVMRALAKLIK
jgi:peptidoglycan/xylan/chitin deacetylase (PgdA/CDA1 family)